MPSLGHESGSNLRAARGHTSVRFRHRALLSVFIWFYEGLSSVSLGPVCPRIDLFLCPALKSTEQDEEGERG